MKYREIGKTGMQASAIGLGCWAMGGIWWGGPDDQNSISAIQAAVDMGMNLIDTAPVYGFGHSEEIVGKALRGTRRTKALIATKCGLNWDETTGEFYFPFHGRQIYKNLAPTALRKELEDSLRRLKTDVIDLYQTHWQTDSTPVEDTMAELVRMKDEGKIRAIGVSNASPEIMDRYRSVGEIASNQPRYNMLDRSIQKDILPYCINHNISILAYSPLAQGLLTGKITADREFKGDDLRKKNPWIQDRSALEGLLNALQTVFQPIADRHSATIAQVAIAWTIAQPGVTHALCGARNAKQVEENFKGGMIDPTPEEITAMGDAIANLKTPRPVER